MKILGKKTDDSIFDYNLHVASNITGYDIVLCLDPNMRVGLAAIKRNVYFSVRDIKGPVYYE